MVKKVYVRMLLTIFLTEFFANRKDCVATLFIESCDSNTETQELFKYSHQGAVKSKSLSGTLIKVIGASLLAEKID